ncbi:MAG: hypothetical protein AB1656_21580 [Candidatus Omnitrophota bacterium]
MPLYLAWIAKYRRVVLIGEVGNRVRELIQERCGAHEVIIL